MNNYQITPSQRRTFLEKYGTIVENETIDIELKFCSDIKCEIFKDNTGRHWMKIEPENNKHKWIRIFSPSHGIESDTLDSAYIKLNREQKLKRILNV